MWLVEDGQLQKGQLKIRDLCTNEFQTGPQLALINAR
jgi:hypothetical protein